MINPRIYGILPHSLALVHGGPGAPGYLKPVAEELSKYTGVLEPLQTADSVGSQLLELKRLIETNGRIPKILAGHSWGAWLSFLFAYEFPWLVSKLILIAPGPFEESYSHLITENRINRMSENERQLFDELQKEWPYVSGFDRKRIFNTIGKLISRADSYAPVSREEHTIEYQPDIFQKVWAEASYLRKGGELLKKAARIRCPVVVLHGDYDPHPWQGVKIPLEKRIGNFTFYLLERCGHEPWNEKHARKRFYEIMVREITGD